ncbi:MAG TPA: DUF929 family protein [Candidatus Dormibacteraeota bacterium]|nr:DUF929 family protein [Candidatus Dormibacteraeota bacterium]
MSKKSMAARRQMREATDEGRAGGARPQSRSRPRGRNYRRNEARRPWGLISGVVGAVAVFIVVVIVLEISLTGSLKQDTKVLPVPASLLNTLTSIPVKTLDEVKAGNIGNPPVNIPASYKPVALSSNGLPEIGFVGAEYCPYCALQRWSIIIGLSPFGTWSGLHTIRSSVYDAPANLPTFTFAHGAKFKSQYLVFSAHELQSNVSINKNGSPYKNLQPLGGSLATAFTSIDSSLGYPFLDYAGKLAQVGSEEGSNVANVSDLAGLTWNQVLQKLRDPKSVIAKEVLGGANYVTAATCLVTGEKPAAVCSRSAIQSLETKLKASA